MKDFEIEVTRIDNYKIEIDESVWTKESIEKWASYFYSAENVEDIAKYLASDISCLGTEHGFYEGFEYVKMFNRDGSEVKQYKGKELVSENEYSNGIKVKLISVDDDCEAEITNN